MGQDSGIVAGCPIALRVNLDVGSTWYALDAKPAHVKEAFEGSFADFALAQEFGLHSMAAGTTIDLIITGLSAGAGVAAVEFLKEAGKDLWKAFKRLLPEAAGKKTGGDGDTVTLTLVIDDRKVSDRLTLPSRFEVAPTVDLLRAFCENTAADLYLRELDRIKREAPLADRLRTYKAAKLNET